MDRLKSFLRRCKELILRGFAMFTENKMSVYSGYATLFIVTAIFPFIMLILAIVNLLPGYSTEDVAAILFQILPDLGPVKDLILSMMTNLKSQSGGLLASAAAVTTLWSASRGVSAIQKGLNQLDEREDGGGEAVLVDDANAAVMVDGDGAVELADGDGAVELADGADAAALADSADSAALADADSTDGTANDQPLKEKAGWLIEKGKPLALGILKQLVFTLMLIILFPALLLIEMLGDSLAEAICSAVKKVNPDVLNSTLRSIDSFFSISSLVVILIALFVILQIFATLPLKRRTLKSQLPGALLTGVCWFLFTELFAFFIPRFYHASSVYGSLASLFLLLLWLRFVVMILFAGGVLNRTLEEEKSGVETSEEESPEAGNP